MHYSLIMGGKKKGLKLPDDEMAKCIAKIKYEIIVFPTSSLS